MYGSPPIKSLEKHKWNIRIVRAKINSEKINYYDFINSLKHKECNEAIKRITPKIDLNKIRDIIDNTPNISDVRKDFYKRMITSRFEKIIKPAYDKLSCRI